jgi:nicotinamidase-related amidase
MAMVKRIVPARSCGILVDVQGFFLSQLDKRHRAMIEHNTASLVRLLAYLRIPVVVTLERPVVQKGRLPDSIAKHLRHAKVFDKDYFDLCKQARIRRHLARLKRPQVIVAGCETDVCVLQSCLGLLSLGFEVYAVEDLLFSSTRDVASAIARLRAEGAVLLTFKSLFYELVGSVEASRRAEQAVAPRITAA